ncbi:hypothetical protein M3221_13775 [Domibacillus indicus]|uniref:hypothetical protein n=1 Tax=Domibacillus indicus TaxID=1437523 RepID=UPI00204033B1|nr:hypothetical protein [Domibacillus indicus]MCM3789470.1 hypothetical protein [Domibacillus indicus]
MKKHLFAGIIFLSASLILTGCNDDSSSKMTASDEERLKKEAQVLDYTTMSESGIEEETKVVIEGVVTSADNYVNNDVIPARTQFRLEKNDDSIHYWVENVSDDRFKLNSYIKVYGIYKGIDPDSLVPVVEGQVVEIVDEDVTDDNEGS